MHAQYTVRVPYRDGVLKHLLDACRPELLLAHRADEDVSRGQVVLLLLARPALLKGEARNLRRLGTALDARGVRSLEYGYGHGDLETHPALAQLGLLDAHSRERWKVLPGV